MDSDLIKILNELASLLQARSLMLATAESCTGGGVSYEITSIAGSSKWFERGFVTYSNDSKIEMLGVCSEDIRKFGAVSEIVAKQMAEGAIRYSHAKVSLAITGIAGPEGGTPEKPVGTCWISWASNFFPTACKKMVFEGDRQKIRKQAIAFSLQGLINLISSN